jgi:hypothetical protein
VAALLIILERVGKATRNPPRDAMLSHAAKEIGYGRAFGVHEALDQFGAMFGPLLVALVLAVTRHDYKIAFASLAVPAVIMLSLLAVARVLYPRPQDLAAGPAEVTAAGLPRVFWLYLAAAALAGAGFADFPLSPTISPGPVPCPRRSSRCSMRRRWPSAARVRWCSAGYSTGPGSAFLSR